MSIYPTFARTTITRITPVYVTDEYGNTTTVINWVGAIETTIPRCLVTPLTGREVLEDRDAQVTRWLVIAPEGVTFTSRDRVRYQGLIYQVVSDVRVWPSVTGAVSSVQFEMERVDG